MNYRRAVNINPYNFKSYLNYEGYFPTCMPCIAFNANAEPQTLNPTLNPNIWTQDMYSISSNLRKENVYFNLGEKFKII